MHEQLTQAEVERMRTLLAQHDQQKATQEFDLNHPPQQPYTYQHFPMVIYNHETGGNRMVKTERELQHYLEIGWSQDPVPVQVVDEFPTDTAEAEEIAAIDAKLIKRGPGRPKKTE